ncbi:site-specific integrase [Pseudoalteromonas sp. Hal040]|uniref:site-specific integrase n=1 Tax=unclassified Pseudoalteromonas TaxID=194690 RepID=UPI00301CD806
MYKLETLIFENGERYPVLLGEDGMPHFYSTLWITATQRNKKASTITNKLRAVDWLFHWEKINQRNLFLEFKDAKFLTSEDIVSIKDHLSLDIGLYKNNKGSSKRKKVINLHDSPSSITHLRSVGKRHLYARMTAVRDFLNFIAELAVQHRNNAELAMEIANMNASITSRLPKGRANLNKSYDDIPEGLVQDFLELAHFSHPDNPFKNIENKKRNYLMILLLRELFIRKGELLSMKITSMDLVGARKYVWVERTQDDKHDKRPHQPVAKTKERKLLISANTASLIDEYITTIRAKIPGAKLHPYLFVVHQNGRTLGNPISIKAFDDIFSELRSMDDRFSILHPHFFRHNGNEEFSKKIDANNKLAELGETGYQTIDSGKEAKMRMHLMGHSNEASGDVYNQRHIRQKANEVQLLEQEKLQEDIKQAQLKKDAK